MFLCLAIRIGCGCRPTAVRVACCIYEHFVRDIFYSPQKGGDGEEVVVFEFCLAVKLRVHLLLSDCLSTGKLHSPPRPRRSTPTRQRSTLVGLGIFLDRTPWVALIPCVNFNGGAGFGSVFFLSFDCKTDLPQIQMSLVVGPSQRRDVVDLSSL